RRRFILSRNKRLQFINLLLQFLKRRISHNRLLAYKTAQGRWKIRECLAGLQSPNLGLQRLHERNPTRGVLLIRNRANSQLDLTPSRPPINLSGLHNVSHKDTTRQLDSDRVSQTKMLTKTLRRSLMNINSDRSLSDTPVKSFRASLQQVIRVISVTAILELQRPEPPLVRITVHELQRPGSALALTGYQHGRDRRGFFRQVPVTNTAIDFSHADSTRQIPSRCNTHHRLPLHVILPNTHHRRRLLGQSLHFLKDSLKPSIHRKRFPHTSRRGFNKKLTPILRPRILPDHAPNHVVNQTRTSTRSLIVSVLSLIVSSRRWVRQRNPVPQPRHIVRAIKVQCLRTSRRGPANARPSTRPHLPALILHNHTPTLFEPGRQNILSVHLKRERGNVIV